MAIKVIEQPKTKTAKCPNCESKLEYTELDVETKSFCCMGEMDTSRGFACPLCKAWVEVR